MVQKPNKPISNKLFHLFFLFFILIYLTQCEKEEAVKVSEEKNISTSDDTVEGIETFLVTSGEATEIAKEFKISMNFNPKKETLE